jgi:type II secretory pathway pseudopilin PulG
MNSPRGCGHDSSPDLISPAACYGSAICLRTFENLCHGNVTAESFSKPVFSPILFPEFHMSLKRFKNLQERGFALISALVVLPLLAILIIGLLGLSTIEIRKSSTQMARDQARANARLALAMAIGQLQKHLGPDQRVSADSRLLEDGLAPTQASRLSQPHWVNVWKSVREDGTPYIKRNEEDGGLYDLRSIGNWKREDERITTLVSGNEGEFRYWDGSDSRVPAEDELVELVGPGTVDEDAAGNTVSAPRVELVEGEETRGAYAWWVGDLGIRANVATPDGSKDSDANMASLRATMLSQDASMLALGGDIDNAQRGKMLTPGQLPLVGNDEELAKTYFHDLTTDSLGLLTDVRQGGLKKDLTAYLLGGGSIPSEGSGSGASLGLSDGDRLVGPRNGAADDISGSPGQAGRFSTISPTFGLLRDWARRAEQTPFGSYRTAADYPLTKNNKVEFRNLADTDLSPVLVEGSLYYNVSYYRRPGVDATSPYGLRLHLYPRVVLWNPYNFEMTIGESMINLQINGKKMIQVTMQNNSVKNYGMFWGMGNNTLDGGAQPGNMYFRMQATTLGPGESVMFSPSSNKLYSELEYSSNILSPGVGPSPSRSFYQDSRYDGFPLFQPFASGWPPTPGVKPNCLPGIPKHWREYVQAKPPGEVQVSGYTQADDYRMTWKPLGGGGAMDQAAFNRLPTGKFISCAYQYGDEDEMPVEWSNIDPVTFISSTIDNPVIQVAPDRRTRDGFRLRWFDEHASNRIGSGSLAGTSHFDCAAMANWNMRGSYFFRNPFDNVTDVAPNFFGIYTRDLFDAAIDWNEMTPRYENGLFRGDPFEQPVKFLHPRILFDVPRRGAEVSSLGAFQHVNFSQTMWQPTYALGNSLADPRVALDRTEPRRSERINRDKGGWNQDSIGYATDGRSDTNDGNPTTNEDNWAYHARGYLDQIAIDQNLIFDLSYELNHSLWDEFFLSSGMPAEKSAFLADPVNSPLPNGRMRLTPGAADTVGDDILDFHRAASRLAVDGAFNVNSTSVTAWEAILLSSAGAQFGDDVVTFPRIPGLSGKFDGSDVESRDAWSGQRLLKRSEVRRLAEEIARQVKLRGPFLSVADFVNRRLTTEASGKKGALQEAIDRSGINASFQARWPLDNSISLPNYNHPDHIQDPTRMEQRNKPDTTAWGALGFLTQADLMQFLGPALTARSDTFIVRAYGSYTAADGTVEAEAWCEAVVQRHPEPLRPDSTGLNPERDETSADFGRHFGIKRFRWLAKDEI